MKKGVAGMKGRKSCRVDGILCSWESQKSYRASPELKLDSERMDRSRDVTFVSLLNEKDLTTLD